MLICRNESSLPWLCSNLVTHAGGKCLDLERLFISTAHDVRAYYVGMMCLTDIFAHLFFIAADMNYISIVQQNSVVT